jgi:diguanylate cyclase (GGDEF)-like protein
LYNLQTRKNIGKAKGLLHSLVPRAHCFRLYGVDRQCAWSSDGAQDFECDSYIADLAEAEIVDATSSSGAIRRTLKSGRTLLVLPIPDEKQGNLGLVVVVFSRNAGKSSSFNPDALATILRPAIELIGESLILSRALVATRQRYQDKEKELALVYEVDEKLHGNARSHSGFAQLVGQSGRFLGVAYSVLLIPSKRVRVSATHSSWKHVNRKVLDRYVIEHIMPKLEGKRRPAIFEVPGVEGGDDVTRHGFQTLMCPLVDVHGNLEGVLAQLGRVENQRFTRSDRRFMAHVMRKVESVVEQSFDAMTGFLNREGFEAQLAESCKMLQDGEDVHQLLYFDLDNMQLVNDTFGRAAGDDVILRFTQILQEDLSRNAVVSRLTGDDFCILLTHEDSNAALALAQTVREKGDALRYLEGDKSLQVSMSVGIAEFGNEPGDAAKALTAARMACESAKDHGRDRIEIYHDDNLSLIRRHDDMQMVSQIHQALDSDGFELVAQPIAGFAATGVKPRFEVLLRMYGDDGDPIPTDAVLSAAERYKMMPQVDRWVVSTAINALANAADKVAIEKLSFAINLSGQTLGEANFLEFIEQELAASNLPSDSICFEITESAAVSNLKRAQLFIDEIRARGFQVALDDFGSGLSSFAYLKNFNVDILKIDGSFIRDIVGNRISESMVVAITQVAKVMGLKTIAEYVETKEIHDFVAGLGVDYAQGYWVGKPRALSVILSELADQQQRISS